MKINSSFIGMESGRTFQSSTTRKLSYRVQMSKTSLENGTDDELNAQEDLQNTKEGGEESLEDIQAQFTGNIGFRQIRRVDTQDEFTSALDQIRQQSIVYLWRLLFGEERGKDLADRLGINTNQVSSPDSGTLKSGSTNFSGMNFNAINSAVVKPRPVTMLKLTAQEEIFYTETAYTSFSAKGMVKTADGRELSFNLDVAMSRSFSRYVAHQLNVSALCDPLVINLNTNVATVSDQKFFFDLDGDGKEEAISRLCEDSGYLALDLNGDGKINDGSELFGTKSGDGFADLAKYDEDGNGWIDENDSVWDKLKIWIQKEDGTSRLYRLKEKDIGAICLQNAATDFTQKNDRGEVNGAIRSTGIFLYENGMAGTMQHLDLAVSELA